MIEFWNVVVTAVVSFVLGLAVHSAYLHSKKRRELGSMPWDHGDGYVKLKITAEVLKEEEEE